MVKWPNSMCQVQQEYKCNQGRTVAHEFIILRNGILETYTEYDEIPDDFDHIIKFLPEIPPEPHTAEQHEEINKWPGRLQKLMEIENARSNKKG